MIRNKSPPGVCWLTVRAGSGILKIFIAFFIQGFIVNATALLSDKEISKKFSQNFTTFSPTL